jgi:hypothetical protein
MIIALRYQTSLVKTTYQFKEQQIMTETLVATKMIAVMSKEAKHGSTDSNFVVFLVKLSSTMVSLSIVAQKNTVTT